MTISLDDNSQQLILDFGLVTKHHGCNHKYFWTSTYFRGYLETFE